MVVGAGVFGRQHARVYRELPQAELAGVYDTDAPRAAAVAQEFGCRALSSLDEVATSARAASVAVPTGRHAEVGCALLERGVDVLVEKPMSYRESMLAFALGAFLRVFVLPRNLGIVTGEAGMMQLFPGLVRIPDVAFASWDRFPDRRVPTEPVPLLVPDLAAEILSGSNTKAEMQRKVQEYFTAGVRLVWLVDPETRTVAVYTAPDQPPNLLTDRQTLDGGAVLPGFTLPLSDLFGELDRQGN